MKNNTLRKCAALLAGLAGSLLLFASCATLISGSNDKVTITSTPEGAEVRINGDLYGKTPLSLNLQKDNSYHVAVSREGYETAYISITSRESVGWVLLDTLTVFPLFVDAITGAWRGLTPDKIDVTLEPLPAGNESSVDSHRSGVTGAEQAELATRERDVL